MIRSGTILDTTELEGSPFAAVIESYRKHARRTAVRTRLEQTLRVRRHMVTRTNRSPRVGAVIYYLGSAQQLERL